MSQFIRGLIRCTLLAIVVLLLNLCVPQLEGQEKAKDSYTIAPKESNWETGKGTAQETKGMLLIDNEGGPYWLISKERLPDNFKMVIKGRIEFLKGRAPLEKNTGEKLQAGVWRTLCVRFATNETMANIMEPKGNLIKFSDTMITLGRKGQQNVKVVNKGNPTGLFIMEITRKGGDYTVSVDDEVYLKYHDDNPVKGGQKFSIGGYLSKLYLGDVSITKLGEDDPVTDPDKDFVGQPAIGPITFSKEVKFKTKEAKPDTAYLSDRPYAVKELPKEAIGGTMLIRDSGTQSAWLGTGLVRANQDCNAYVGLWTGIGGKAKPELEEALKRLTDYGWKKVEGTFKIGNDEWGLYRLPVKKGIVDLPDPGGGPRILIFK